MQKWVVICWALLALVGADECPDGGRCGNGQTCCNDPANGFECCPFDQAECCGDHMHCCPAGTVCDTATSSCLSSTGSIPWVERAAADQPGLSKSFRMIKSYMGEDDENVCPDLSRCPPEFSCLRALTKYGCCPLAQGVPCSDGKHCCPEGHQCSTDCRSCIKNELPTTVLCSDGVSECPGETSCCETSVGMWGCCPLPKAVCCRDKLHCCPEGSTCDVENSKCISLSTKKVTPMWAKLPARMRAVWENKKEDEHVTAQTVGGGGSEKSPEVTTASTVPPPETEVPSVTETAAGNDVPCDDTGSCPDNTTCCKNQEGGWSCCPLPEAVCCEDLIHCCPKGKKCNVAAQTCEDQTCSVPWVKKVPAIPKQGAQVRNVSCDSTHACPDGFTCCKTQSGDWSCCPLPQAVCCEDHIHCCPTGTTCDLTTLSCDGASGSTPMVQKIPTFSTAAPTAVATTVATTAPTAVATTVATTVATSVATTTQSQTTGTNDNDEEDDEEEEDNKGEVEVIQCDDHTTCPESSTCCFMSEPQEWGCCPLPQAVCCPDGIHCCPAQYKCEGETCIRGEVVIPWYTKLPATTSIEADPNAVQCDRLNQCPEHTTCCQLLTGEWGCCPLQDAVCCPDKQHCCPQGYTCNMASNSCQKLIMLQLETVPLTRVNLIKHQPMHGPSKHRIIQCDEESICPDGNTCCRISATTWGCCPVPNAVCCTDMTHCCPNGYTCSGTGECVRDPRLQWHKWDMFFNDNKKRALIL